MTARVLDRLSSRPRLVVLGVGASLLAAYVASLVLLPKPDGRIIVGDAVGHFVQLRSAVYDHDFDFANDFAALYGFAPDSPEGRAWIEERRTPTGHVRNFMPVGPALLWAPGYLATAAVLRGLSALGIAAPADGTERVLQAVPGITGILAVIVAAWIAWRLAERFTDRTSAVVGLLGIWLGSHAIYYSLISPAYSHAASMLAATLVVAHWVRARAAWSIRAAAVSGALVGLATLMRWQDAVWIVVPAIECLRWRAPARDRLVALVACGAAAAAAFTPQMVVWQALYGQPLAIPQGAGFIEWTRPNLVAVLFSDKHGLFSWSPILVLAVVGFVGVARRERWMVLPVVAVVALSWYVNAAVSDWWAGEAFGARRFLSFFPLFVVGLSGWLHAGRPGQVRRAAVVAALVVANGLLLVQYQTFMKGLRDVAPYPEGGFGLWVARFVVPARLIARWWS
ncbi:MAG: hypothetical protein R2752_11535 [Vicinamibacterales bacterium]